MNKIKEKNQEFLNDFNSALESVNHKNYNPTSQETMNAVFTGLLWYLTKEMEEHYQLPEDKVDYGYENDEIKDELMGAEKYWKKYAETKDEVYKQMASDELRHAEYLLTKAKTGIISADEKNKICAYDEWSKQISSRFNK